MRYFEFAGSSDISEFKLLLAEQNNYDADVEAAKRRLRQLRRERMERIAAAVHAELRRYASPEQLEKWALEDYLEQHAGK